MFLPGDSHSHGAICFLAGGNENAPISIRYAAEHLAPDAENILILANPVLPRSQGEIVLQGADPHVHPSIRAKVLRRPVRHEGHSIGEKAARSRQPVNLAWWARSARETAGARDRVGVDCGRSGRGADDQWGERFEEAPDICRRSSFTVRFTGPAQ